jgi:hypothetical protein
MSLFDESFHIGTVRFTNKTLDENKKWREKHNWKGCIYGLSKKTKITIGRNALIYVIEMNNDTNTVEGIGLIRNYINMDYRTCIYSDKTYNRFIYNSVFRIDKKDFIYPTSIRLLEVLLFYGSGHYKRGKGITVINWNTLHPSIIKVLKPFFTDLFKSSQPKV